MSAQDYLRAALAVAQRAAETQVPALQAAATAVADTMQRGNRFWVFGSGHSHLLAEELWGRAGGLVDVHPILEPALMLHEGLEKSSRLERLPGLAAEILEIHGVSEGDCLLVVSNSGRNAVPVEMARGGKARGATVIALTSLAHSRSVTSRAPDGSRLFEVADIVIDNCGEPGDAIMPHEPYPLAPTSTVIGALLLQAMMYEVVLDLERRGVEARTYESLNVGA
ncbi:SIS domain-containing protein [Microbacterium sp. NPDC057659]|uniref:SIS domain-containing protein n=1 Tax=Microbacterium sp. NPDC057659 TaxID=3346198 RepID=UPI00366B3A0E